MVSLGISACKVVVRLVEDVVIILFNADVELIDGPIVFEDDVDAFSAVERIYAHVVFDF